MYTYGILAIFLLILSGIIFGKRIKQNQFAVVIIVVTGTLIGTSIVNGLVGLDTPLEKTLVKTRDLDWGNSHMVLRGHDSALICKTYIDFEWEYKIKKNGDTALVANGLDIGLKGENLNPGEDQGIINRMTINYLELGDSIPRLEIHKMKRHFASNKWVTPFGVPNGKRYFDIYIPNDSAHNLLMETLEEKFFKNEEQYKRIAQLN
jgi:hypothetical protein